MVIVYKMDIHKMETLSNKVLVFHIPREGLAITDLRASTSGTWISFCHTYEASLHQYYQSALSVPNCTVPYIGPLDSVWLLLELVKMTTKNIRNETLKF